jgi:hypothetical protein
MAVERFSMTMEPELGIAVRSAAAHAGVSVSRWLADAAAARLRNELLGAALDAWELEQGAFTAAELAEASAVLGVAPPSGASGSPHAGLA